MFSAEFDYHKASSVAEAIQLLGAHPNAKLMAGGHSLIPLMKLRLALWWGQQGSIGNSIRCPTE